MLKFLILAALLYGVYFIFFKKSNSLTKMDSKDIKKDSQTMVACKECETYISPDEAYIKDAKYFCSKECMDAYTGA